LPRKEIYKGDAPPDESGGAFDDLFDDLLFVLVVLPRAGHKKRV